MDFLEKITGKSSCFIIAELSANHNGDIEIAKETIKAAKESGADAIKLQTYTADTMTLDVDSEDFIINQGTIWDGRKLHELYQEAYTPWEWHPELFEYAKKMGLLIFSSPFDFTSVDFLEPLNVPLYKVASFEITDLPLISYIAKKKKPIILSTGIASKEDIELALKTIHDEGNFEVALLKCTSSYPAPLNEANLQMVEDFRTKFNVISGLSDHTLELIAPIVAVTKGARIIEKHFILDKKIGGPDASFSLEPKDFTAMVNSVRSAESALGKIDYVPTKKMISARAFSRSIYVSKDVSKGDTVSDLNVRIVRPGFGLAPKHYKTVLGKKFNGNFKTGTRLTFDIIE